jgi:hypothetical protein
MGQHLFAAEHIRAMPCLDYTADYYEQQARYVFGILLTV